MSGHEQFAEDLALHALRSLEGEERAALERHLETCSACRQELERLQGDLALVALSVAGANPPQRARGRLLQAIAREPRALVVPLPRTWWALAPRVAAVLVVFFAILLWWENARMRRELEALRQEASQSQALLARARGVVEVLTAPEAAHFTLVAAAAPPQPQGKAIYVPKNGGLVFVAGNLAPLPPEKTYELWLLPASGAAPVPAGLFRPDARGSAMVLTPPLPAGVEAKGFAVTIESAQGSGSATPTMPIVLV
ncbi:MAG: anti-sigma factor, partial [Terriglobales bacterium]